MKWQQEILQEIADHITRFGLQACPVCGSQTMSADQRPVILPVGGAPWATPDGLTLSDRGTNILYMVMVRCHVCAYSMLFDSELFHDGDTPTLEPE